MPGRGLLLDVSPFVLALVALAGLALAAGLLSTLVPQRRRQDPDAPVPHRAPLPPIGALPLFAAIVPLLLGAAAVLWLLLRVRTLHYAGQILRMRPAPALPGGVSLHTASAVPLSVPLGGWGLTLALASLALGVLGFALWLLRENLFWLLLPPPRRRRRAARLAAALSQAADRGLEELRIGSDPRQAVIACYRGFERAVADRVHRRAPWQTPREYVGDALRALSLPRAAAAVLLGLFERARFSDEPVTEDDRQVALQVLGRIRAALGAGGDDAAAR